MKTDQLRSGKYRHYRTAKLYEVLGEARHTETHEEMIIYKALYHCDTFGDQAIWVRPKAMFCELVSHLGQSVQRFQWISD